jgi:hypothetical protein
MSRKSIYKANKNFIKSNYLMCAGFAVAPLAFSMMLGLSGKRTVAVGGGNPALAAASLIITAPLTAVTAALGLGGVLVNSVYGAVSMPLLAVVSKIKSGSNKEAASSSAQPEQSSSTNQMLQAMPASQEQPEVAMPRKRRQEHAATRHRINEEQNKGLDSNDTPSSLSILTVSSAP